MFLEFLTPEVFDALVIVSVAMGLAIAGRRFRADLQKPLPEDAPSWARDRHTSASSCASSSESELRAPL